MGETRAGLSGSSLLLLLSLSATLSETAFAATTRRTESHPATVPASGTRFTRQGAWIVGMEGLFDLTYARSADSTFSGADENGNAVQTKTTTSFLSFSAFSPKVALDAFVDDHVSIGLTAGYSESNYTNETTGSGQSYWTSQTMHALDVTPRVGLAYMTASGVGAWIRGGLRITSQWSEFAPASPGVTQGPSTEVFGTDAEVLGTFAAQRNVVFSVGPWIRKMVASSGDGFQGAPKPEAAPPSFGLTFGVGLVL